MAPLALALGSCVYLQCTEPDKMYTTPLVSKPHPCGYVNKTTELSNPGFFNFLPRTIKSILLQPSGGEFIEKKKSHLFPK